MWYASTNNTYIQDGQAFELDGISYPPQWIAQATPEQKTAIGLEEVVATNSPKSDQYYWVSTELNGASLTYVNTPKDSDIIKELILSTIKQQAYSLLQPTDYVELRNIKDNTYKPEWILWRDSIRQQASNAISLCESLNSVQDLENVLPINWNPDPNSEA